MTEHNAYIDHAQQAQQVPDYFQELERNRHKGNDFFILKQDPRWIGINLRCLIGENRVISKKTIGLKRVSYWQ
ncbi:zonular occludens toxin domain-containing protein, partial [Kingella kingae]|uniref:zonular occludens toxin domain-containing protein n=1 Tax=Kingella kingae TaxID=504 RepID=UPI002E2F1C26